MHDLLGGRFLLRGGDSRGEPISERDSLLLIKPDQSMDFFNTLSLFDQTSALICRSVMARGAAAQCLHDEKGRIVSLVP